MKEILLTQGKVALVNNEDYEYLSQFAWYAHFKGYAVRHTLEKNRKLIYMHRDIMERMNPGFKGNIDHVDGNGFNNQRSNLRIATHSQNLANRGPQQNNTSGYKGVCWYSRYKKWKAYIKYQGVAMHLGLFDNIIEAARTYDRAALRLFGEFAKLNFPEEKC